MEGLLKLEAPQATRHGSEIPTSISKGSGNEVSCKEAKEASSKSSPAALANSEPGPTSKAGQHIMTLPLELSEKQEKQLETVLQEIGFCLLSTVTGE